MKGSVSIPLCLYSDAYGVARTVAALLVLVLLSLGLITGMHTTEGHVGESHRLADEHCEGRDVGVCHGCGL